MQEGETPDPTAHMSIRWRLFFCALFFGPAAYAATHHDYVLAALCVGIGVAAFSGYRAGAIYILALLVGISAAVGCAADLGLQHELQFTQWFGTTGLANRLLSIGVIGSGITLAIAALIVFIGKRVIHRRQLDGMNRWIGFSVGAVEGLVAIVFFLGGMLVIEPIEQDRAALRDPDDTRGMLISKVVLTTAEHTRHSSVGPMIQSFNPFERIPGLNKIEEVQKSVQLLSDPQQIQGLLHHPSIRDLQRRPEVQRAVDKIRTDPEIQQVLNSGQPMNRKMAMTLLNHPAVLELIDQPGFMEQAAKAIEATAAYQDF